MGEMRYLELALDVLNKRDNLQKAGVQGNVFRRILNYLGIDEDLYVWYEEVCNGKMVDCLIDIKGIRLPIYILNYNKEKRDDIHYLNEQIKGYESLLKQFMVLNKTPLGVITNGYTLIFFELTKDNDITRIRNIWLPSVIRNKDSDIDKGILPDRTFLEQYSFENIEGTFSKYLDLELLDNFISDNILNVSDILLEWVNTKLDCVYPLEALKDSINKAFFNKILLEKKEKMKSTVTCVERDNSDKISKEDILKLDIPGIEKLNRILESPCICSILDEQMIEFTGWRDFFVNVLEFVLSKNKVAYQEFIDKRGHKAKFNVIQPNVSVYQQYVSDSNYRKLSNGDLMYSSLDRVRICNLIIDALEGLKIEKPFITIVYSDNTSLTIEGRNTANPVIPNKLDNNDELNLSYMQTVKKY